MTGRKKDESSRRKRGANGRLEHGTEAEEAKREKASERAPVAPGRAKQAKRTRGKENAPGRVVAIGIDVPKLSELEATEAAREKFEREAKRRPGQPTDYRPEYVEKARLMCRFGATDMDLADEFGVRVQTIWNWRCKHSEFFDALLEGKDAFDDRIERSLAQRAAGYSVHVEKVYCSDGQIIRAQTVEHYPPEIGAIKLWLGNRRPDKWKDKQEVKLDSDGAFLKLWQAISSNTIGKLGEAA
jgi:hypothetical protein